MKRGLKSTSLCTTGIQRVHNYVCLPSPEPQHVITRKRGTRSKAGVQRVQPSVCLPAPEPPQHVITRTRVQRVHQGFKAYTAFCLFTFSRASFIQYNNKEKRFKEYSILFVYLIEEGFIQKRRKGRRCMLFGGQN